MWSGEKGFGRVRETTPLVAAAEFDALPLIVGTTGVTGVVAGVVAVTPGWRLTGVVLTIEVVPVTVVVWVVTGPAFAPETLEVAVEVVG
jgi:hypothetical protein